MTKNAKCMMRMAKLLLKQVGLLGPGGARGGFRELTRWIFSIKCLVEPIPLRTCLAVEIQAQETGGEDLRFDIKLTLEEAAAGVSKKINYRQARQL
jgi:hypothetical protein